jgi:hypothetical protein
MYFFGGGKSFGFSMGGGNPSTSGNLMSIPTLSGAGLPFGWIFSIVFGIVPSQIVGNNSTSGDFKFSWVITPFLGGPSLWGNFSPWGYFPFVNKSSPGGFFLGANFGNFFPGGSTFTPRGMFSSRSSHAFGSATIPRGTHSLGAFQPSSSKNIRGPQGSSRTTKTSTPSQYSFPLFPFLIMLELPNFS